MAPVEFLSMGHSSSLVFAHLVEVDGFLSLQGHGPVPNSVSIRNALQAVDPRQFCSMGILGCAVLSSDTRVGSTDLFGEEGAPEYFLWSRLML